MSRSAEARALFKHIKYKDVDSKIRESREDLLLVMQSEHKQLDLKINNLESTVNTRIDSLESTVNARIDSLESTVNARIDSLVTRIDSIDKRLDGFEMRMDRMETRMDRMEKRMEEQTFQIVSMKKWAVGLFLAVVLSMAALLAPIYISLFM